MEHINSDIVFFLKKIEHFSGLRILVFKQLVNETSEEVALRILARFSVSLAEAEENIRQGLEQDQPELVWKACHKLVGTAELLGFHDFGIQSRQLNQNIQASGELSHYRMELNEYLKEIGPCLSKSTQASLT